MRQIMQTIVLLTHRRMNRVLLLACLVIATCTWTCRAQTDEYAKEKAVITEVKRNPSKYVYAEATCKTEDEAKAVAEEMFLENINEYAASVKKLKGAENIVVNDQRGLQQKITMPRGTNMHRVFLYVNKSDIVAMKNPVVLEKKASTSETLTANERITPSYTLQGEGMKDVIPEAVKEIARLTSVQQLNQSLRKMKQEGRITAYDKYNNIGVKSEWYLVIYDSEGIIKAVLTEGVERTNVRTGKSDSEKNYPKHAAIGVKVK